jgi:CheY-like chemotaxis protein
MGTRVEERAKVESLRILVVGNNPIDLSHLLEKLKKGEGKRMIAEIAFDIPSILDRLSKFTPDYILIDDNIGRDELKKMVSTLLNERKTKQIPITVLKNSNYHDTIATSAGILDFILKDSLTGEAIYLALKNSLKLRQTQLYLYKAYKRRKGQLARLFVKAQPSFQI